MLKWSPARYKTRTGTLTGNLFILPLDQRYYAWAMVTITAADTAPEQSNEAFEIMATLAFVPQEGTFAYEGFQLSIQPATCEYILSIDDVNQSVP